MQWEAPVRGDPMKSSIPTAHGKSVMVDAKNLKIKSSGIIKTDILASNGVTHEIGAVLLPPSDVATAMSAPIPCK